MNPDMALALINACEHEVRSWHPKMDPIIYRLKLNINEFKMGMKTQQDLADILGDYANAVTGTPTKNVFETNLNTKFSNLIRTIAWLIRL